MSLQSEDYRIEKDFVLRYITHYPTIICNSIFHWFRFVESIPLPFSDRFPIQYINDDRLMSEYIKIKIFPKYVLWVVYLNSEFLIFCNSLLDTFFVHPDIDMNYSSLWKGRSQVYADSWVIMKDNSDFQN